MHGMFTGWMQDWARSGVAALALGAVLLAPSAWAQIELEGGGAGGSLWTIDNTFGTSNDEPIDGFCNNVSQGQTVVTAVLDPDNTTEIGRQPNAYDNGQTVWVDGFLFAPGDPPRVTERSVIAGPQMMSGLAVWVEYGVATASATMRTLIAFRNDTAAEIRVAVEHLSNVGTNAQTAFITPAGSFNPRWTITHNDQAVPRPVVTHVSRGPDACTDILCPLPPTRTVYDCPQGLGTEGIRVIFEEINEMDDRRVAVPKGETRYLLFFNQLNQTVSSAFGQLELMDDPPLFGDLLFDLLPEQLLRVVNWKLRPEECREALKLNLTLEAEDGKLKYRYAKGEATLTADWADPLESTQYTMCFVDFEESFPFFEGCLDVMPGLEWKQKGNGFKYRDKNATQDGITHMRLRRGEEFKTKITVRGENVPIPELPFQQDPEVAVLVRNDQGTCWIGRFDEPAKQNDAEAFKAKQRNKRPKPDEDDDDDEGEEEEGG